MPDDLVQVRAETARLLGELLGVQPDELDYITEAPSEQIEGFESQVAPPGDEDVPQVEVDAATARGSQVVPNRISYGVRPERAGFNGNAVLWRWIGLRDTCVHTTWNYLWSTSINRFERAGWCRRPQTDTYDIRYKIYWRA